MTDITRNFHGGNPRSIEAHESTKSRKQRDYARILTALHGLPDGLICDEAEVLLGLTHQTCSARFSEMKAKGWLVTHGKRRTRSGCDADVHFPAPIEQAEAAT